MSTAIQQRPAAIADVNYLLEYFWRETGDAELSDRFFTAYQSELNQISEMPFASQVVGYPSMSKRMGVRRRSISGFTKYLIFYRVLNESGDPVVEILRVLHGMRDLETLLT